MKKPIGEDNKIFVTHSGLEKLKKMKKLYSSIKEVLNKRVLIAKSHGDLRENFEYSAAQELKGIFDSKYQNITKTIADCRVVNINSIALANSGVVKYGACVYYTKENENTENFYILVSPAESNLDYNLLSMDSPTGFQLLSKRVGQQFFVTEKRIPCTITRIVYDADLVEKQVQKSSTEELKAIVKGFDGDLNLDTISL